MDVKILKFTTQITRAHAHHQGRARRAGHKFWSVCATKVATKCSTAKSTSTCSMPAMLSAFHNSNISLTETFWRLCKRVELNLECLPRGQARLRERAENWGNCLSVQNCPPARRARHYVQGRVVVQGEGERQTSRRNGALAKAYAAQTWDTGTRQVWACGCTDKSSSMRKYGHWLDDDRLA